MMFKTEPLLAGDDSAMKQFGAAFAATNIGALFFCALLVGAGITFIGAELGAEKLGRVFFGSIVILNLAIVVAKAALRKFYVAVLLPNKSECACNNFLVHVRGGFVTAANASALWGKEGAITISIPLNGDCGCGLPIMTLKHEGVLLPIKYLGFGQSDTPVKWQAVYDFAVVKGNTASVRDALINSFNEAKLCHLSQWHEPINKFLAGELATEQLLLRLGQAINNWNLCPFAPIVFELGAPNITGRNQFVMK